MNDNAITGRKRPRDPNWFVAEHGETAPPMQELRFGYSADQKSVIVTHDSGKRLWIGFAHACIRAVNAHDPLVKALSTILDGLLATRERLPDDVRNSMAEATALLSLLADPAADRGFAKPESTT